jgi:FKBP-type peptidyl-prolyl cis-trans isomerase SlyD
MKIDNNMLVSLVYELHEGSYDGKILEKIEGDRPLSFIYGTGRLLPSFESNLGSLSPGDNFRFTLSSFEAYGERREEMIIDVPVSVFQKDGMIDENICRIGNEVPMMDSEGNPLNGIICGISDTHVKMDFNHPMAGVDLYFTGKVLEVREPSDEEFAAINSSCSGCNTSGESTCGCGGC